MFFFRLYAKDKLVTVRASCSSKYGMCACVLLFKLAVSDTLGHRHLTPVSLVPFPGYAVSKLSAFTTHVFYVLRIYLANVIYRERTFVVSCVKGIF